MIIKDCIEIQRYCMSKPCVYETRPFGKYPICYKVAGKIFAQINPTENRFIATLKTNPDMADFYRFKYPKVVTRGYHCPPVQQPYWNTIDLFNFNKELLFGMIDEAYKEVVDHLPKKIQKKLPFLSKLKFCKTDGKDDNFKILCDKLDENLDEIAGNIEERKKYSMYNMIDDIHNVIIAYLDDMPIASVSTKLYDFETIEIKRLFVDKNYRGLQIGKELLNRIEADAKMDGYKYAILETSEVLLEACMLYKKQGYKVINNYGQYIGMEECVCMRHKI